MLLNVAEFSPFSLMKTKALAGQIPMSKKHHQFVSALNHIL
jgi:hypothetical protein